MNNKKWLIGIGVTLGIMMNNVSAQNSEYCDREKYDTASLKQCGMKDLKMEKEKLDQVYKKLMSTLDSENKKLLKISQLAWVDFSKKDCVFQTDWETGTMGPLMSISCETGVTEDRRKSLEDRLTFELEYN
ncbi:lysozyme inhibitor LprI family protein [Psychrobacter glacincola]|uniref:lysozyme inhibitor LprI family protein n=1 Tax=Psychrobacter glacincola TaxID=56810 RepID=UPI0039AF4C98